MRLLPAAAVAALVAAALTAPLSPRTPRPNSTGCRWTARRSARACGCRAPSGSCTSNFVFYERHEDDAGDVSFDVYIGLAAHCFGLGGATGTNGCSTGSREIGEEATVGGAVHPGTLAYSSWATMQEVDETDGNACAMNDFALIKLDPRDYDKVNPTLQYFGGPTGLRTTTTSLGEEVYSYGNSSLRLGISQLSPKRGWSTGTTNGGWSHRVYTVTPGIPGDSGSAFVDDEGAGLDVVVTLQLAPFAGANGVTDLARALACGNAHTDLDVQLALGTEPFADPVLA
jgi:hypothetical protein